MLTATNHYELSPGATSFDDRRLLLTVSRENAYHQFLVVPRTAEEPRFAHFVGSAVVKAGPGEMTGGACQLTLTPTRLLVLVMKGNGTHGPLDEEQGRLDSFSVDWSSVGSTETEKNWRGKPKSITLRGGEQDPFQVVITDLVGMLPGKSDHGRPTDFAEFAMFAQRLCGRDLLA